MPLNVVINNEPAQSVSRTLDTYASQQNLPYTGLPPGSTGPDHQPYPSELVKGNPGGVDAAAGVGLAFDTIA